jgi:ubiquinone/menaquinone biosynthesis methyltransferase
VAGRYYTQGSDRADRVHALFSAIAGRYDLINDLQSFGLHRLWKRRLVRLCGVQRGERVLDVCCGTGDVAFRLAAAGARVTGVDFNQPMLDRAEARKARFRSTAAPGDPGAGEVRFVHGDALHLPFDDETFDLVTIAYGLRNLASVSEGLGELLRVLRPGGRLAVLDFGHPASRLWRGIYFGYLRVVVPVCGRLFCGDAEAYAYILDSLKHYPAQRGVAEELGARGCTGVEVIDILGGSMGVNLARRP